MDPYKILGIKKGASEREIRRAYREKAAKHHPDNGGDAWAFQQVNEAFDILTGKRSARKKSKPPVTPEPPPQPMPETGEPFSVDTSKSSRKRAPKHRVSPHLIGTLGGALCALIFGFLLVVYWDEIVAWRTGSADADLVQIEPSGRQQAEKTQPRAPLTSKPERSPEADEEPGPQNAPLRPTEPKSETSTQALLTSSGIELKDAGRFVDLAKGAKIWDNRDYSWLEIPESLSECQFWRNTSAHQGRTGFNINQSGLVVLAVAHRPSPIRLDGGDWETEIASADALRSDGWEAIGEMTADMAERNPFVWTVYRRECKAGDQFSYRTDKYIAPVPIVKQGVAEPPPTEDPNQPEGNMPERESFVEVPEIVDLSNINEPEGNFRTWTAGDFEQVAKLVSQHKEHVLLRKRNGDEFTVPRAALSAGDQEHLIERQINFFHATERMLRGAAVIIAFYRQQIEDDDLTETVAGFVTDRLDVLDAVSPDALLLDGQFRSLDELQTAKQDAASLIDECFELANVGFNAEANEKIRSAYRTDLVSLEPPFYMALFYLVFENNFDQAERLFEEVIERSKLLPWEPSELDFENTAAALNNLALLKARRGRLQVAEDSWKKITNASPAVQRAVASNVLRMAEFLDKGLIDSSLSSRKAFYDWQKQLLLEGASARDEWLYLLVAVRGPRVRKIGDVQFECRLGAEVFLLRD